MSSVQIALAVSVHLVPNMIGHGRVGQRLWCRVQIDLKKNARVSETNDRRDR